MTSGSHSLYPHLFFFLFLFLFLLHSATRNTQAAIGALLKSLGRAARGRRGRGKEGKRGNRAQEASPGSVPMKRWTVEGCPRARPTANKGNGDGDVRSLAREAQGGSVTPRGARGRGLGAQCAWNRRMVLD